MVGLLCLGKPDFEAVEAFREDPFFSRALGLEQVPSAVTLRQRMDALAECGALSGIIRQENAEMIRRHAPAITPCHEKRAALDLDVSPFDNSKTKKEGVSFTYKKVVGYAPIFAYLGAEGYLVNVELREGKQHCQSGTPLFLQESICTAKRVTDRGLLVRMDSGNDDTTNLEVCAVERVDWLIKRNLRKESVDAWLEEAMLGGELTQPRPGKAVYRGIAERERKGKVYRIFYDVVRRTIDSNQQMLLLPTVEADTYWTSLQIHPDQGIGLYHAHGTSEQFHAELKSDMDLERLPSGKFATNGLVLELAMVAYNILRLIGQTGLAQEEHLPRKHRAPVQKKVSRRRVSSVMKDLMYMACRFTRHARGWGLSFWKRNPWLGIWRAIYERFLAVRLAAG